MRLIVSDLIRRARNLSLGEGYKSPGLGNKCLANLTNGISKHPLCSSGLVFRND